MQKLNKRDEKSKQNTKLISELRHTVRKQNVIVNEVETQRQEILTLRAENEKLKEAAEKQYASVLILTLYFVLISHLSYLHF
jgi:predicted ribosome quality control (RQC) complex YloA/Tae2 family protein